MSRAITTNLPATTLAFRGYNVTNLGRTPDLLQVPAYRTILAEELHRFGAVCREITGSQDDLPEIVESREELGIERYSSCIAMIAAIEIAHLRILQELHGFELARAGLAFGYSLGELMAVSAVGLFEPPR